MNGLEALKEMRESATLIEEEFFLEDNREQLAVIEQELKALEIIKEKEVDLGSLLYYVRNSNHPLAFYNKGIVNEKKKLTKDEFNLLKEVLE